MEIAKFQKQKKKISRLIGQKIKLERKGRKMTQVETAKSIGLHQAAFSRIEAGTQDITAVELLILCREFEIELTDLMPKG